MALQCHQALCVCHHHHQEIPSLKGDGDVHTLLKVENKGETAFSHLSLVSALFLVEDLRNNACHYHFTMIFTALHIYKLVNSRTIMYMFTMKVKNQ